MKPVTAESFWNAFEPELRQEILTRGEGFPRLYESNPQWTQSIMQTLRRTGITLGYPTDRIWTEYYRLDMTLFSYPEKDYPHTLWNLEVAIEHENESGRWHDEFVKLSHMACGLKVLISYHNYASKRSIEEGLGDPLRMYERLRYKPPQDAWLIIFAPTCHTPEKPWVGLTFDGRRLERRFEMTLYS